MKKNSLSILIVFMALSLIGIVLVQIRWIRHAMEIRNEQFNNRVKKVMNESVEKIETLDYINVFAHGDTAPPPPPPPVPSKGYIDSIVKVIQVKIPDTIHEPIIKSRSRSSSSTASPFSSSIRIDGDKIYIVNGDTGRTISLSNVKRLHDSLGISGYEIKTRTLPEIQHIEHNIEINGDEEKHVIIERLKGKERKINWVARKMVDEILITKEDRTIPFKDLQDLLKKGFQENNIETDVILALIQNDSITQSSSEVKDSSLFLQSPYITQLYPNDIFLKDAFLSVAFPGKRSDLYKSMAGMLLASLIFSLFILTAFGLSIHFILRQKKISDVKSDFINNMTHEFKTPIATISVAVDTLTNKKVLANKSMLTEYAGIIKAENQRMNGHVEKILSVARMERKETEFKFAPVDVHALIEELVESFRLRIEACKGAIEEDLRAENPFVPADAGHLYNALQNIIDNAIKYSPDAPFIQVNSMGESHHLVLEISDRGMGMSRQVQAKIFDTFYRQPTGNLHNIKGFGLGLSYVKTVIEMHHGKIDVNSKPGEGSTFKIYLPYSHG